jgi:hypothetical protein
MRGKESHTAQTNITIHGTYAKIRKRDILDQRELCKEITDGMYPRTVPEGGSFII